ncbi:MAG: hypothetical protein ABEI77_10975 [Halorientalis sp.]
MRRRRFLTVTASATALSAFAGCTQSGERGTETPNDTTDDPGDSPGGQPGTDSPTADEDTGTTTGDGQSSSSGSSSGEAWGSGGTMNGVDFSFTSRSPKCGTGEDDVDISFDTEAGEVSLDGVISGDDLCKRAQLASVDYDEQADELSVSVETVDQDECKDGEMASGQCLVDIPYEATFSFDDGVPSQASVSHDNGFGASAAHGSASASASPTPSQ